MSERDIIWSEPRRLDRWLGSLSSRITAVFSAKPSMIASLTQDELSEIDRAPAESVHVRLGRTDGYAETFDARTTNQSEIQKIARHEATRLDPCGPGHSVILSDARSRTDGDVSLLFVKPDTIATLESRAGEIGVRRLFVGPAQPDGASLPSPATSRQTRFAQRLWLAALIATFIAAWSLTATIANREARALALLRSQETETRALVSTRRDRDRQVTALQRLAEHGVDRNTVDARLDTLRQLNDATPDGSWWLEYDAQGDVVRITGLSASAAATRNAISEALPDRSVTFAEAVADESSGQQSYVIEVVPKP